MRISIVLLSLLAVAWTPFPTSLSPDVPLAPPIGYYTGIPGAVYFDEPSEQYGTDVASDGRGFFAVSSDSLYPQSAMLLDEHGEAARSHSIAVSNAGRATPAVAWSGQNYLVVWEEPEGRIVAARYTPDGVRIDREPVLLRTVPPSTEQDGTDIDAAWDGSKFIVVTNSSEVAHIGADGSVLANHIATIGKYVAARDGVTILSRDRVAAGGAGFFVVYFKDDKALYGRALDAHGVATGAEIFFAHNAKEPALAWNGTHWVVTWVDAANNTLYVIRQDVDQSPLPAGHNARRPSLASNGTSVVLTWEKYYGSTLVPHKAVLDADGLQAAEPLQRWSYGSMPPAVTRIGTTTLVAWRDATWEGETFLRTQPVVNGVPLAAQELKLEGAFATAAIIDAASNGVDALVAMPSSNPRRLHLFRVGADGAVLRHESIDGQDVASVRVLWTGTHYVVVWHDIQGSQTGVYRAARVAADGTLIDDMGTVIGRSEVHNLLNPNPGINAAAAADGTVLVVWTTRTSKRGTGVFLSPELGITELPDVPVNSRILALDAASDGDAFLIVYSLEGRVAWVRASRDGVSPLSVMQTPAPLSTATEPRTFWTGENYLVVRATGNVDALRIAADATAIDNAFVRIAHVPAHRIFGTRRPAITFTDTRALEFAYVGADDEVAGDRVFFRSLMQTKRRNSR